MPVSPPKAELLSLTAALCIWLGEVKVTGCELSWPALSGHKAMEAVHALTSQGGGDRPCWGSMSLFTTYFNQLYKVSHSIYYTCF